MVDTKKLGELAKELAMNYEDVKEHLIVKVIGKENSALTFNAVHTDFEDLALVYSILLSDNDDARASVLVTESLLNEWGISQETLHDDAVANCERMYPADIFNLNSFLGILGGFPMLVVSNSKRMNGAVALFYPGVVEKISKELNGSFIVLPSSVHEVIAIPDNEDVLDLASMVKEINRNEVAEEDQLSDHVYRYDCKEKKLRLVA